MQKRGKFPLVEQEALNLVMTDRLKMVGRVAMDSKNRVSIAKAMKDVRAVMGHEQMENMTFRLEVNDVGQVILTPEVSIPAHEVWLYRNPDALESVQRGMREPEEGKAISRGSFAEYADDDIE